MDARNTSLVSGCKADKSHAGSVFPDVPQLGFPLYMDCLMIFSMSKSRRLVEIYFFVIPWQIANT